MREIEATLAELGRLCARACRPGYPSLAGWLAGWLSRLGAHTRIDTRFSLSLDYLLLSLLADEQVCSKAILNLPLPVDAGTYVFSSCRFSSFASERRVVKVPLFS